ncbi:MULTISPECIES: 3-hydroxyacyl-CoA dehydrogenase NAD-binding domain-containing protein [Burkholderia]|uniref:3-hydroxyacyl-CoA dehydrogenase NAD-binding domain-containing protein n=1 Tax=Burkholderia TaxID=32008 RepID=UPI00084175F7|nr:MULTISPECIES: 3-hydroxyacyl-CoA dehydrogenase NAD-binding domain-containing protein [unclassified Burkholderia]AOK29884.1 3-hydroxyacyl-CoA dehydrogenase [Burkholderia sp. Bp7605]
MTTHAIHTELDHDGILTVTIDLPGRSMNVLDDAFAGAFAAVLARIEADQAVNGAVITSGKADFIAGADIDRLYAIDTPQQAMQLADDYKALLRRIEKSGKPVVAALNGTALGGGYELALACHHRIAIDDAKLQVGLPEVKLGLLPGGGGTQRLPRLIGIQRALLLLLEGKTLRAEKALAEGLIDALAANRDELLASAKAWARANPKPVQPWDRKDFRIPGGDSKHPGIVQVFSIAPAIASAKTQRLYPAATDILSCVFEGCLLDIDSGLRVESRYFAHAATSQVCRNMIGTFWYQLNALKKGASRPAGVPASRVGKLGVLGAGMMGAGIAYAAAKAGIDVVLKDVSKEAAEKGRDYSAQLLDEAIAKRRSTPQKKEALLARIHPSADAADLAGCDLIIEAVFEDRDLKARVTQEAEAVMAPDGVFASNTSTLPITGLAEASSRAERFVGIHFFSPVDKMPLVEIIRGAKTSPETIARAFDFVLQIGKTPIVVNDGRGFYTSRVFSRYIAEGARLVAEGQNPRRVDMAAVKAGMPVGPLTVLDEVSLTLPLAIMTQTQKDLGDAYQPSGAEDTLRTLVELGRTGKKDGRGIYDYGAGGKRVWPELSRHFAPQAPLDEHEIAERVLFAQALEAVRAFDEQIVTNVADANIGSVFALGFCPQHGGVLQYINAYGVKAFVARAQALAQRYGERFAPPASLLDMAERGAVFAD